MPIVTFALHGDWAHSFSFYCALLSHLCFIVTQPICNNSSDAISIKLLPFYQDDPLGWFLKAKAKMCICGVMSAFAYYWYLVAALDVETGSCIGCALKKTESGKMFDVLKEFLLCSCLASGNGHKMSWWSTSLVTTSPHRKQICFSVPLESSSLESWIKFWCIVYPIYKMHLPCMREKT